MNLMEWLIEWGKVIAPIVIALVGIIPTIKTNRKKTQESIESVQGDVKKLQTTLDAHIKEDEENNARNRRYRILRFNDEICEGRSHSESHFEDILEDCDEYQKYCEAHKDTFKNHRGGAAMKNIQGTYDSLKAKGKFKIGGEYENT